MGKEIKQKYYTKEQEKKFDALLEKETKLLKKWIKDKRFKNSPKICGYEAEGWIIKEQGLPYACSDRFLENVSDAHITPELSKFNFEINGNPFPVDKSLPQNLKEDFEFYWKKCSKAAQREKGRVLFIGIWPNLKQVSFGMRQMYPRNRYYAINQRIHSLRKGSARIQIQGKEKLVLNTSNIIHEAETTSLQIHLQVDFALAKDFYNSSLIASPIMSALCANAPFVYGKELWDESRIPLFEQVIALEAVKEGKAFPRVGLGQDFVKRCVSELFDYNLLHPVLLAEVSEGKTEKLQHLLLHNGTIWRWNRPIISFDKEKNLHFRVEHRVPSAGPSLIDMQANILFFIGLIHGIQKHISRKKLPMDFKALEKSFYQACKQGLSAKMKWLDGNTYTLNHLIAEKLVPLAKEELQKLSLNSSRVDFLMDDVIKNRALSLQNGACWQKAFINKKGKDFCKMVEVYWENQQKNLPVYQWKI